MVRKFSYQKKLKKINLNILMWIIIYFYYFLGGYIVGSNQLWEKYLPMSYEFEVQKLKNLIKNKMISITVDVTSCVQCWCWKIFFDLLTDKRTALKEKLNFMYFNFSEY